MFTKKIEQRRENKLPFPKLMISPTGVVTLFNGPHFGVVVHVTDTGSKLRPGTILTSPHLFSDFQGQITMSNFTLTPSMKDE